MISGIITVFILMVKFIWSIPDGNIHVVFCDVGQGDSIYVRYPDGRDMLIDGGPDESVLRCLGRHMPFWDRHINIFAVTHPQKDHLQGLIAVASRYSADYFLKSDSGNTSEGYTALMKILTTKGIPVRYMIQGDEILIGHAALSVVWPTKEKIASGKTRVTASADGQGDAQVLGATLGDLNDYSLVFLLNYGMFDVLLPGDADMHVEPQYSPKIHTSRTQSVLADNVIEVLKYPHHGSKTGMSDSVLALIHPAVSVISVGKNSYGHPASESIRMLQAAGVRVYRTDESGDVEFVSDGTAWTVKTQRTGSR